MFENIGIYFSGYVLYVFTGHLVLSTVYFNTVHVHVLLVGVDDMPHC